MKKLARSMLCLATLASTSAFAAAPRERPANCEQPEFAKATTDNFDAEFSVKEKAASARNKTRAEAFQAKVAKMTAAGAWNEASKKAFLESAINSPEYKAIKEKRREPDFALYYDLAQVKKLRAIPAGACPFARNAYDTLEEIDGLNEAAIQILERRLRDEARAKNVVVD